jgi:hypothetical protein
MITLAARDELGRLRAETSFRKSWRKNDVTGKRESGFKIIHAAPKYRVDWGSLDWFFVLPIGQATGIIDKGLTWALAA